MNSNCHVKFWIITYVKINVSNIYVCVSMAYKVRSLKNLVFGTTIYTVSKNKDYMHVPNNVKKKIQWFRFLIALKINYGWWVWS